MNKKSKGYILAIILTIIAVSLLVYEIKENRITLNIFNKKEKIATVKEDKVEDNNNTVTKLSKEEEELLNISPIGKKVKNNLNYPDKEEIHFKLFNAVDNFKTCKGEFIKESALENSNIKYTFTVDVENKSSVSIENNSGKAPITLIYHDDKRKVFNDNDKTYREFEEIQSKEKPILVKPIRLFLNSELSRKDTGYLGMSQFIISSDSLPNYLFIYEDWEYTESTFLDRSIYKIDGVTDSALSTTNDGKFSLIMDKETGIILQYLCFDDTGNVKDKLECTSIEINAPIDESIYNKDTSGYVKK
ncbi:MAG: hypothetical protein ACRCW0_06010 [Clostridium sp.]